jgi:hypothetical protein
MCTETHQRIVTFLVRNVHRVEPVRPEALCALRRLATPIASNSVFNAAREIAAERSAIE